MFLRHEHRLLGMHGMWEHSDMLGVNGMWRLRDMLGSHGRYVGGWHVGASWSILGMHDSWRVVIAKVQGGSGAPSNCLATLGTSGAGINLCWPWENSHIWYHHSCNILHRGTSGMSGGLAKGNSSLHAPIHTTTSRTPWHEERENNASVLNFELKFDSTTNNFRIWI